MQRRGWLLAAVVVGLVGVGVFLLVAGPATEAPSQAQERRASPAAAQAPAVSGELEQVTRKAAELEAALKAEREVSREALRTIRKLDEEVHTRKDPHVPPGAEGPLAFPAAVTEVFQPQRVREIAAAAASECGMKLEVLEIDCSEYPCMVWTRATDASVKMFDMGSCEPWAKAYGMATMVFGSGYTREGQQVHGWLPVPPEQGVSRAAVYRARERARATAAGRYDFPAPLVAQSAPASAN